MIIKVYNNRLNETSYLTESDQMSAIEKAVAKLAEKMTPKNKMDADKKYKLIYQLSENQDIDGIITVLKSFDIKTNNMQIDIYQIIATVKRILIKNGVDPNAVSVCCLKIWVDNIISYFIYHKTYTREEADKMVAKCLTYKNTKMYTLYAIISMFVSLGFRFVYRSVLFGRYGNPLGQFGMIILILFVFFRFVLGIYRKTTANVGGGYLKTESVLANRYAKQIKESFYTKNEDGSYNKYTLIFN